MERIIHEHEDGTFLEGEFDTTGVKVNEETLTLRVFERGPLSNNANTISVLTPKEARKIAELLIQGAEKLEKKALTKS